MKIRGCPGEIARGAEGGRSLNTSVWHTRYGGGLRNKHLANDGFPPMREDYYCAMRKDQPQNCPTGLAGREGGWRQSGNTGRIPPVRGPKDRHVP